MDGGAAPDRSPKADRQSEPDDTQDDAPPAKPPMSRGKKILLWLIGLVVLAALIVAGVLYWLHARHFESTDDAFIDGNQSQVAAQISGRVTAIVVSDNQHVDAGQELLTIDPRDYQVRLDQSRAQTASAQAQARQARAELVVQRANVEQQQAQIRVAEADLLQAQQDLARIRGVNPAAITRQQVDQSSAATKTAAARLDSARQAVVGGQAQIEAQLARIDAADAAARQAQADTANAELQLSYTHVSAPQPGRVTKRSVNLGNYVTPGQPLLAVVPEQVWVTANFKETQLTFMRVGQPVEITIDAYPNDVLHGHIDSMQAGTGAAFSVLPAENATGNYVKVVQRVPVKIVFDNDDARRLPLAPGLSVSPRVTVR